MMKPEEKVTYHKDGAFFIIKLNSPQNYNAMSYDDFLYLTTVLDIANKDDDIVFTVLQSSGKFFSSGANFHTVSNDNSGNSQIELKIWLEQFLAKNQYITSSFIKHEKILIACLNGSAIGLSAAIVLLCDLVYCMNSQNGANNYLQFPFAQLGLSCEGATSLTMPWKLGANKSYPKLLFGEKIEFKEIMDKVIVKDYNMNDVDEFNNLVLNDLKKKVKGLYLPACLQMRTVLRNSNEMVDKLMLANSNEVHGALPFWVDGEPQRRFEKLRNMKKKRDSKL